MGGRVGGEGARGRVGGLVVGGEGREVSAAPLGGEGGTMDGLLVVGGTLTGTVNRETKMLCEVQT